VFHILGPGNCLQKKIKFSLCKSKERKKKKPPKKAEAEDVRAAGFALRDLEKKIKLPYVRKRAPR